MSENVAPYKEFKVGDTCELNSGSPELTVEKVLYNGNVIVSWTNSLNEVQYHEFPLECLTPYEVIS